LRADAWSEAGKKPRFPKNSAKVVFFMVMPSEVVRVKEAASYTFARWVS
jgi:hypothetical protein